MVANDPGRISANFGAVETGAQDIINHAKKVTSDLEAFHQKVVDFVTNHWEGAANDAFSQLQATWNTNIQQLNATLQTAGQTVSQGNSDLQSKDKNLANLF